MEIELIEIVGASIGFPLWLLFLDRVLDAIKKE